MGFSTWRCWRLFVRALQGLRGEGWCLNCMKAGKLKPRPASKYLQSAGHSASSGATTLAATGSG